MKLDILFVFSLYSVYAMEIQTKVRNNCLVYNQEDTHYC